ncbi:MAG TPA: hypothetical protein VKY40_07010, partial [Halanaerobiales bacterium]|nr:hypothetical protein [Halanaerobiales bacterium]
LNINYFKKTNLKVFFLLIFVLFFIKTAAAVEIGGNIEMDYTLQGNGDISSIWQGGAELEFYLPESSDLIPRCVLKIDAGEGKTALKYLYLRRKGENYRLTLGRQPISWAYGSVINPFNYGFAVEGLGGETTTLAVDGLNYTYLLGQGRRLEFAVDYPQNVFDSARGFTAEKMGTGFRLRLPAAGLDFNLQAVSCPVEEPLIYNNENFGILTHRFNRAGLTFKKDFDDFALYGAGGYYLFTLDNADNIDDIILQLGFDSSFYLGEFHQNKVFIQGEYMRFVNNELNLGNLMALGSGVDSISTAETGTAEAVLPLITARDLLILNLDYQRDMFSSIGLALMAETEQGAAALMPYLREDLGGGLEFRLQGSFLYDGKEEITPGAGINLKYYF